MNEYVFLYRGRDTAESPEQMQKTMEKWVAWMKDLGAKGQIVDMGHPLESKGSVVQGTNKVIVDGPFAEAKDIVAGFTLIKAKDQAEASEIAKGCPILETGGSVEVRPIQKMSM